MNKSKTIFCDLDGTLVKHCNPVEIQDPNLKLEVLKGTHEKLRDWDNKGYTIIITTGRKESLRSVTEKLLSECGIIYDKLIMGIGGGKRYLINDRKPYGDEDYAVAINIDRNIGINGLEL